MLRGALAWIPETFTTFLFRKNRQYTIDKTGFLRISKDISTNTNINKILGEIADHQILEIKKINLYGRGLTSIPSNIERFENLQVLNLGNNKIKTIKNYPFERLNSLKELYLDNNELRKIKGDTFRELSNLEILNLSNNAIEIIKNGAFKTLTSLKTLNLDKNRLTRISYDTLEGLESLSILYLNHNQITEIGNDTFRGLLSLDQLYLEDNKILKIESRSFERLSKLRALYLQHNQISEIKEDTFEGLSALVDLNLEDNKIEIIENSTFEQLSNLRELTLSHNEIAEIDCHAFERLFCLEKLRLQNNKLKEIKPGQFKGLKSLQGIGLNDNQIKKVASGAFEGMLNLRALHLNDNKLEEIEGDTFKGLSGLMQLYLQKNELSKISSLAFKEMSNLLMLDLHRNRIESIERDIFKELSNLWMLDLHDNRIKSIKSGVFEGLKSLQRLYLNSNQIESVENGAFRGLENPTILLYLYNNNLVMLPDSIRDLSNSLIWLDIEENPNFSLESGDGMLGIRDLQKIFGDKMVSDVSVFLEEYKARESLHWNLDKFKELCLPSAKDISLSMNEMLQIIDKILTEDEIRDNVKDYIQRIHGENVMTTRKYPMIDKKDFSMARKLLGNILKHLEELVDTGHEDVAKANLAVLSNGMTECHHGQIAALNDAYALIIRDYKSQSDNIVDILEHRIAVLKDLKFRLLVTPFGSEQNVHVLNYWINRMKDTFGLTANLDVKTKDVLHDDPFGGNRDMVLQSFLDNVFTPDKIISILTKEINSNKMEMNALISFIVKDETLTEEKKEKLVPDAYDSESVLYKKGVKENVIHYILTRMNLLNGNDE